MAARKTTTTSTDKAETVVAENKIETAKEDKPIVPKEIDLNQYITVINGFQGSLVFKNPKTGEIFRWAEFGDEQDIELRELKGIKSYAKNFFANNWFMFNRDDYWVIDYLGLSQYYKYAINLEEFDALFEKSAEEIKKTVSKLSAGQKKSVAYRARQLVSEDVIDSRKTIKSLEEALDVELIEK